MFSLFKSDPMKKLINQRDILLEKAFQAQRNGNIREYSRLSMEADEIEKKIESMKVSDS